MCGKFKCGNDHLKLNADLILDNAPVTAPCADSIFEENDDLIFSIADDAVDFALANLLENADLMLSSFPPLFFIFAAWSAGSKKSPRLKPGALSHAQGR